MSRIDTALLSGLSRLQPTSPKTDAVRPSGVGGARFDQSLEALLTPKPANTPIPTVDETATSGLAFSKHAQNRMASRGLSLDSQEMGRLEAAVDSLAQRGAKESLVLTNDQAYVVGVPKRTVITMMSRDEAMGQVFTNIDSTYVAV